MCCYTILCLEGAGSDFIPLAIPLRDSARDSATRFHFIPFISFHSIPFRSRFRYAIPFHYQCVHTYTIFSGIALVPEFAGNNKSSRVRPCI